MSLVRVQLWEPKRADDKSHLLFCCFKDNIYSLTVNQDGVGERSESGVKAGKRKLYSVQFSRRGRLRRVQLWEPKRADDESHLLFCCFGNMYIAWLLIKMELVNGAEIIQSLSQLR